VVLAQSAGVPRPLRSFHEGCHTAITSDAISGSSPVSIITRAGHSSFATTQRYIHAAGVTFRDEAVRAEHRILSAVEAQTSGTKSVADGGLAEDAATEPMERISD